VVRIRRPLSWVLSGVSLLGVAAAASGAWAALHPAAKPYYPVVLTLTVAFLIMSPWSVRLPSGAAWRPSLALVTTSMFLLPVALTSLVPLPAVILAVALRRGAWRTYPFVFGQVAVALYLGSGVYRALAPPGDPHLPEMLPAALAALAVNFIVNRFFAGLTAADREKRRVGYQLRLVAAELNWGQINLYLTSIMSAVMYQDEGPWGLVVCMVLLAGIYQSVSYYTTMHEWQQAASRDGLTGVENRTAWEGFLSTMLRNRRCSGTLFMMDLDNFKAVNDTLGHQMGDQVLRDVAARLREQMRRSDRVFRFGGDEFVIFATHAPDAARSVRERVMRVIADIDLDWQKRSIPARLSVGFATWPAEAEDFPALLALADQRMYSTKAKHKGLLQSQS
jgi:diguanylate cyclase (GGDEF)-like protein